MTDKTEHEILLQISDDVIDIKESVTGIRKTLYGDGNGEAGLVTKHSLLKDRLTSIYRLLAFIGGTVVVTTVGYFFSLLVK